MMFANYTFHLLIQMGLLVGSWACSSYKNIAVSITHFFLFSHRQPKNTKEIIIRNDFDQLIIKSESKVRLSSVLYFKHIFVIFFFNTSLHNFL